MRNGPGRSAPRPWSGPASSNSPPRLSPAPSATLFHRAAAMTVFGAAMYSYLALVLLQRVFDQPLVGLIALAIVLISVLAGVPITQYRIPPFFVAWIVPLVAALSIGYVHPAWQGFAFTAPWSFTASTTSPLRAMWLALPVSLRHRSHGDLPGPPGHRLCGRRSGRRRRLRPPRHRCLGRSRDAHLRSRRKRDHAGHLRHAPSLQSHRRAHCLSRSGRRLSSCLS